MIINANELNKTGATYNDIVDAFCDRMMETIAEKNKEGQRSCCFYACSVYLTEGGEIARKYGENNKCLRFDDYSDSIKKRFEAAGYKIKPTGYIGGVWQLTEDIYW